MQDVPVLRGDVQNALHELFSYCHILQHWKILKAALMLTISAPWPATSSKCAMTGKGFVLHLVPRYYKNDLPTYGDKCEPCVRRPDDRLQPVETLNGSPIVNALVGLSIYMLGPVSQNIACCLPFFHYVLHKIKKQSMTSWIHLNKALT